MNTHQSTAQTDEQNDSNNDHAAVLGPKPSRSTPVHNSRYNIYIVLSTISIVSSTISIVSSTIAIILASLSIAYEKSAEGACRQNATIYMACCTHCSSPWLLNNETAAADVHGTNGSRPLAWDDGGHGDGNSWAGSGNTTLPAAFLGYITGGGGLEYNQTGLECRSR